MLPKSDRTLRLSFPLGGTLLLAALILVVLVGVAEAVARTRWVEAHVPTSIGSANQYFDAAITGLDFWVKQRGKVECLILGSSQVRSGVQPQVVAQAYRAQTGREIGCYNFGIPGAQAALAADIAAFLVDRYHPRLLVYGISLRELRSDGTGSPRLTSMIMQTPWVRYRRGEFDLHGWLVDHMRFYRSYLALRRWPDPEFLNPIHDLTQPVFDGYVALRYVPDEFRAPDYLETYAIAAEEWDGLGALFDLASRTRTPLLLVEVPIHPQAVEVFRGGPENYRRLIGEVGRYAAEYGLVFLTPPPDLIPENGWLGDAHHLNPRGAQAYSAWLGEQIGAAVARGDLALPGTAEGGS